MAGPHVFPLFVQAICASACVNLAIGENVWEAFGNFGKHGPAAKSQPAQCRKTMAFGWGDAVDEQIKCTVDPAGKPINL